jgi:hypothetical protein
VLSAPDFLVYFVPGNWPLIGTQHPARFKLTVQLIQESHWQAVKTRFIA